MEMESYNNCPTHIFDLPEKIRVKILKYLRHDERLLYQFVCRKFRNDIRLRVGIQTKITDETIGGIIRLRDVKIQSLIVGKYERPMISAQKLIFRVDTIKELVFEPSKIFLQYFDSFLLRLHNITTLSLCNIEIEEKLPAAGISSISFCELRNQDLIKRSPVTLGHLKNLKISLLNKGSKRQRPNDTLLLILRLFNTPNLKNISLVVRGTIKIEEAKDVHHTILRHLIKNPQIIRIAVSTFSTDSKLTRPTTPVKDELKKYAIEKEICPEVLYTLGKRLDLKELICTESSMKLSAWLLILTMQNFLQVLQILHPVPWINIKRVLVKNNFNLRRIALNLTLNNNNLDASFNFTTGKDQNQDVEVNLACFGKLICLEELYISIANTQKNDFREMFNFKKLPITLKTLGLKNCSFHMDEFIKVLSFRLKINSLGIIFPESTGSGCTYLILKDLLKLRTLDELLVVGFSMKKSRNKFNSIFRKLNQCHSDQALHIYPPTTSRQNAPKWKEVDGNFLFALEAFWAV